MKKKFVVTDEEGNVSWNAKTEASETFGTLAAAEARARGLAAFSPGREIRVYELCAEIIAPVGPVTVNRAR